MIFFQTTRTTRPRAVSLSSSSTFLRALSEPAPKMKSSSCPCDLQSGNKCSVQPTHGTTWRQTFGSQLPFLSQFKLVGQPECLSTNAAQLTPDAAGLLNLKLPEVRPQWPLISDGFNEGKRRRSSFPALTGPSCCLGLGKKELPSRVCCVATDSDYSGRRVVGVETNEPSSTSAQTSVITHPHIPAAGCFHRSVSGRTLQSVIKCRFAHINPVCVCV